MNILEIFGLNIKKYRMLHELSQEEFAFRLSLNTSNINRIENGKQFVTVETLQDIVNILDIPPSKLFETGHNNIKQNKRRTYKDKLINYAATQTEEDSKFFFEYLKLYAKHKIKNAKTKNS